MFLLVASGTPASFVLTGLKLVRFENSVRAMKLLEVICSRIVRLLRIFSFFFSRRYNSSKACFGCKVVILRQGVQHVSIVKGES